MIIKTSWVCNECNSEQYILSIKESDINKLQCSNCGCNEFHKKESNPCCSCDGWEESECCGELIILHDICSLCGEHCSNRCEECDYKQYDEDEL